MGRNQKLTVSWKRVIQERGNGFQRDLAEGINEMMVEKSPLYLAE